MLTKLRNFLCLMLTLVIVIGILPIQAVAAFASDKSAASTKNDASIAKAEQEFENKKKELTADDVVGEVIAERSADTKHFMLADGSFIAVQYDTDVHFKDENGKWKDINNGLKPDKSGLFVSPDNYTVENNNLKTSVSANSNTEKDLETTRDKYSVSFDMINAKETEAKIEEQKSSSDRSLASALELPNISSTVTYAEIQDGIDLQYTMYGNEIKESINVNQKQDEYRYSFKLNLTNLKPVENSDGSISLVDNIDGKQIYLIPAPFMFDVAGATSNDVSYALEENDNGDFILTVAADKYWINDDARQFPVTIDPTLIYDINVSNTEYTYISEGTPNEKHNGWSTLYLGYDIGAGSLKNRILFRIKNLPVIPDNSVVLYASMSFKQLSYTNFGKSSMSIDAHALNSSIAGEFNEATWSNQPSISNEIVDYNTVSESTRGTYVGWDITRITKSWYADKNQNYGAALIATDESEMDGSFCAMASFYTVAAHPKFVVQYRNNVGLENYYTYNTQNIGRAGTGYIGDYTAQLTLVKPDASIAGASTFDLSHIYNSTYSEGNFSDKAPHTADYSNMLMGYGWKLNAQQSVVETTVGSTAYLVYTDGDGTEHYFAYSSGYYYDEDGLNLKIQKTIVSGVTKYIMTDAKGNTMEFYNGLLAVISDANGNKIRFIYNNTSAPITGTGWYPTGSDDRLLEIRQYNNGESNYVLIAALNYWASGYLKTITDRIGNITTYTYTLNDTCTNLTSVTHADTTTATYSYEPITLENEANKLIKAKDVETKYSVGYSYNPSNQKINGYTEYGTSESGNQVTGDYVGVNANVAGITEYKSVGADRAMDTDDDILTHYVFDYFGRTINKYSTDNDRKTILGTAANSYMENSGTSKENNKLITSASVGVVSQNLLKYGGMEATNWWPSGSGQGATLTLISDKKRTGNQSQKVVLDSSYTGTAKYVQVDVPLSAGTTYVFSAYVNTAYVNSFTSGGIYLSADDGTNTYIGDVYNNKTSPTVAGGWSRITLTFTPTSSGNHTLNVCYNGFTGTAYADDAQLEVVATPGKENLSALGNCNLINEGGFENGFGWVYSSNVSYDLATKITGAYSIKIDGNPNNLRYAYQDVQINLPGDQTFVLSGWAKAASVPTVNTGSGRTFALRGIVVYSDGTSEVHDLPFCADTTEWQYVSSAIVPKQSAKTVSYIRVSCRYDNNANIAYFDNISLVRELVQIYKYDPNGEGKLISIAQTDNAAVDYQYYANSYDLWKAITADSGTYEYAYDGAHNVTSVKNNGVTMSQTYDGKGNATSSILSSTSGAKINSSATYTDYGNLLATMTDSRGYVTEYAYAYDLNKQTGQPSSIKDPNGNYVYYNYIATNGRPDIKYIGGKISVDNDYTNGRLANIARGGYLPGGGAKLTQNYTFGYDAFGNMSSIKVGTVSGERTLATYNYADGNGLLRNILYGNGAATSYTYDLLGRIKSVVYDDDTGYNYTYTGDGQLYQIKSLDGNYNSIAKYDTIGRLLNFDTFNDNTDITQNLRYSYDLSNRLMGFGYIIGFTAGGTPINEYEYFTYNTDGTLASKRTGYGDVISYTYDDLKRVLRRDFNETPTNNIFSVNYAYVPGSGQNGTTPLVWGMRYLDGTITLRKLGYTYDALGNILTVSNDSSPEVSYVYDAQKQLTSETISNANIKYTYTYDTYGNIREVKSEPISGGAATIKTYTYDDAKWLDLLTAYNGSPITYDNIGNPLSYYDGTTMTWQNGRQLKSLTKSGTTTSYIYNADGIRTQKTVGGVVHNYVLDGMRILADYSNGAELKFAYDENNHPQSFTYNGTKYNYITNLQGDVIEIRDNNNALVGSYIYNAYGKIVSKSGSMADINPLRYRGYYQDSETGFYYLNSRYYDSEIGRFINADSLIDTGEFLGYNLFAYCGNNPVNASDPTGHLFAEHAGGGGYYGGMPGSYTTAGGQGLGGGAGAGNPGVGGLLGLGVLGTAGAIAEKQHSKSIPKESEKIQKRYTVYTLKDPDTDVVKYVGRTVNYNQRMNAHKQPGSLTKDLVPGSQIDNLNYETARGLEQYGMLYYHTHKSTGGLNQIRGISQSNPNGVQYSLAALDYISYGYNQVSNEIYNWAEGG